MKMSGYFIIACITILWIYKLIAKVEDNFDDETF